MQNTQNKFNCRNSDTTNINKNLNLSEIKKNHTTEQVSIKNLIEMKIVITKKLDMIASRCH